MGSRQFVANSEADNSAIVGTDDQPESFSLNNEGPRDVREDAFAAC